MSSQDERKRRLAPDRAAVKPSQLAHVVRRSRVELQVDNMPSGQALEAWMRSGESAANPIGVVFDPEALSARYEAGEPLETLTRRPPLPEGAGPFDMLRF